MCRLEANEPQREIAVSLITHIGRFTAPAFRYNGVAFRYIGVAFRYSGRFPL